MQVTTISIKPGVSRVVGIILSVLMIICGASCFAEPVRAYGALGWIAVAAMVADGVGKILLYLDERRAGLSDVFALASGIVSVVLGVVLLANQSLLGAAEVTVAYLVGLWTLAVGAVRIVRSFKLRHVEKALDVHRVGSNWDVALLSGLVLVVLGLIGLANPLLAMVAIAWQVGAALLVAGIALLTATV